jgi:hypothetical protein
MNIRFAQRNAYVITHRRKKHFLSQHSFKMFETKDMSYLRQRSHLSNKKHIKGNTRQAMYVSYTECPT